MKRKSSTRFQNSDYYFDDCAICEAMKQAEDEDRELGLEELKSAFKKANKKGSKSVNLERK